MPTAEVCGAAAREVLGCISWKGRQSCVAFMKHVAEPDNLAACYLKYAELCCSLDRRAG